MQTTIQIFDKEIKKRRDLNLLKHAACFPKVIKYWEKTRAAFLSRGGYVEYKDPRRQNIFQAPATAHYKEHYFDPYLHNSNAGAVTVELARFAVPAGAIGMVRRLNQWVTAESTITSWGDPWKNNPDIDSIVWSLRLVPFDGSLFPRLVNVSPDLPGIPHSDLPEIRFLWYPPQAAQSEIALIVPGGYCLKLIARLGATPAVDYRIMGRLCGYWQSSEYKLEAGLNLSRGW